MINIFKLNNNPLFMATLRQRNRLPEIVSKVAMALLIVLVTAAGIYMGKIDGNYIHQVSDQTKWHTNFIYCLAIMQGILMIIFGSMFCFRMAEIENQSGTMNFHRSSPTKISQQILGLLLGSTYCEWLIFFSITAVELLWSLLFNLNLSTIIRFNLSIIPNILLINLLGGLIGLTNTTKQKVGNGIGFILFLLFASGPLFAFASKSSFLYNLSCIPAYDILNIDYISNGEPFFYDSINSYYLTSLYNIKFPALIIQYLTQLPFIFLTFMAIKRIIKNPERPILSKKLMITSTILIFTFINSDIFNFYFHRILAESNHYNYEFGMIISFFIILSFSMGIIGSIILTPKLNLYLKGLNKRKKLNIKSAVFFDDSTSNINWLSSFSCITILNFFILNMLFKKPIIIPILESITILSHVWIFANILEWFKLSKFNKNVIVMVMIFLTIWVVIPIASGIIFNNINEVAEFFASISPFLGGAKLTSIITNINESNNNLIQSLISISIMPLLLSVIAILLSKNERRKVLNLVK